jgi:hypothetical protein
MMGLVVSCLLAQGPPASPTALPLDDGRWELSGDAAVETFDGRQALRLNTGAALRRDVRLQDGTIDLDVQLSRRRSFVYVTFRMQDEREFEEIYLRPHKSELPDTVQYAPVYQRQSAWQLYHGPGGVNSIRLEPSRWIPVRIVLSGRRAALYVDDMTKPALVVPRLGHEPKAGFLGLRAFVPPDTPGAEVVARYSNVRVQPGVVADLSKLSAPAAEEPGRVREWAVSESLPALAAQGMPVAPAPATVRTVAAEASGLVEMHRHVKVPEGSRELTAAARVTVTAAQGGLRVFDLGFSDRATVFLNGRPVFRGEGSYSYAGRREGLIGYDQARLYLDLRSGENELMVVLSDSFGGMGLMGRFVDDAGLTMVAR